MENFSGPPGLSASFHDGLGQHMMPGGHNGGPPPGVPSPPMQTGLPPAGPLGGPLGLDGMMDLQQVGFFFSY